MKVVIRAGGVGSRLWPVSRKDKPKQFQRLLGNQTLLQQTYSRARMLALPSDIFVSTHENFSNDVLTQLPELAPSNVILEPLKMDTGPAIGLESIVLASKDPSEIVVGLPSDHHIGNEGAFKDVVQYGVKMVEKRPDHVLCVGIRPSFPATAFGYIQMEDELENEGEQRLFKVASFKEKPDQRTATEFYRDWRYLWNAGYFMWRLDTILNLFKEHEPKNYDLLMELQQHVGTAAYDSKLREIYPKMESAAIDYMIIEKNKDMMVVPADMEWSDIGDWSLLGAVHDDGGHSEHVSHDTESTLVRAPKGKVVATVGLKNMAVIDTEDALLVCPLERAQEVKEIVKQLEQHKTLKDRT